MTRVLHIRTAVLLYYYITMRSTLILTDTAIATATNVPHLKRRVKHRDNLVVVIRDGHLHIQTHELAQVPAVAKGCICCTSHIPHVTTLLIPTSTSTSKRLDGTWKIPAADIERRTHACTLVNDSCKANRYNERYITALMPEGNSISLESDILDRHNRLMPLRAHTKRPAMATLPSCWV